MLTFAEFVKVLETAEFESRTLLHVPTAELMIETKLLAQSFIGHEEPKWKPLADVTVEEKLRKGYGGQISGTDPLLRTWELYHSIEVDVSPEPYGAEGVVGSADKVALYQEMGTSTIPARSFLGMALLESFPTAERVFSDFVKRLFTPRAHRLSNTP